MRLSLQKLIDHLHMFRSGSNRRRSSPVAAAAEICESRQLLTQFVVTSAADNEVLDGQLTLREAVIAANTNAPYRDAAAGGAQDEIVFHESLLGARIELQRPLSVVGRLTISGSVDQADRVVLDGGDQHRLLQVGENSQLSVSGVNLVNGRADSAAAVWNQGSTSLEYVQLTGHTANGQGGAIVNSGQLQLHEVLVADNTAGGDGGGLYSTGSLTISASQLVRNSAAGNGGALAAVEGGVRINTSTVSDNHSEAAGGGVFAQTQLLVQSSGIHDNTSAGSGGGVAVTGLQSVISNSTIAFNAAGGQGGGAAVAGGSLTVLASTVVRNQAAAELVEGGGAGGGLATAVPLTLASSIVLGNRSGPHALQSDDLLAANGGAVTASYSLLGDPNSAAGVADEGTNTVGFEGGLLGVEQVLRPDRDPTSRTLVLPLIPDSPAIDHGKVSQALDVTFSPLVFDQRGAFHARVRAGDAAAGEELDAGAWEFHPSAPSILRIETSEFLSSATVTWQAGHDATHHELVLENLSSGQTGANSWLVDRAVAGTAMELTDLPDGRYRVWVRGVDADGVLSGWSVRTFQIATRTDLQSAAYAASSRLAVHNWVSQPDAVRAEFYVVNRSLGHAPVTYQIDTSPGRQSEESFAPSVGINDVWVRTQNSAGVWSRWSPPVRYEVVPELTGPEGGLFDVRPEFRWHAVRGAVSYEIWVQTGRSVVNVRGIESPRFQPDADLAAGDYRWWVRAEFDGGRSSWSRPLVFHPHGRTTVFAKKESPVDSPLVRISFAGVAGASEYELYVRHADTRDVVFHGSTGPRTERFVPLPISGNYEVWARAIAEGGTRGTWSAPAIYKSNGRAFSNASVQIEPVPNSVSMRPTFRWDAVNGAQTYAIVLWHQQDEVEHKARLSGSGVLLAPDDLQHGQWQWYVRGADGEGFVGDWVPGNSFLIGGQTQLVSPVQTEDRRPELVWQPVTESNGYEVALFSDGRPIYRNREIAAPAVSIRPDQALNVGRYRAWVRVLLANRVWGPWSAHHDFEIV
ncbi:MAG: hypothetical protein NXI04_13060 [Planctomycetaceae bacterium]|nr:hypothetical protein [Planctomycetaceae bacterium]